MFSKPTWPLYFFCIITVLSQLFTAVMNITNSLIWWGRIDIDLILIGCIDSFVVTSLISPPTIYLIKKYFNLGEINLKLQKEVIDRKHAEEALRESEERFSKAFNTNPGPMAISEIETGRFIDVNEQTLRSLEFTREEMIGHTSYELGIWDNPEDRTRMITQLHSKGSFREYPVRFITKSRNTLDVLWSAEIITTRQQEGTTFPVFRHHRTKAGGGGAAGKRKKIPFDRRKYGGRDIDSRYEFALYIYQPIHHAPPWIHCRGGHAGNP